MTISLQQLRMSQINSIEMNVVARRAFKCDFGMQ